MTGADMRFLMGVAASMGLRVHGAYLPSGEFGYYSPDEDRIYFDLTTPSQIPDHWWGVFAIWQGGLGIWGGIAAGVGVGLFVAHRRLG